MDVSAQVVGDVHLGAESSIWMNVVVRGDVNAIRIGARSNLQDLSMVHMTTGISNAEIGEDVTIGHGVTIHGARVGSGALIGIGAILLDNASIGERALVAAGSLVPSGMQVPPGVLVRGKPARVVRELDEAECNQGRVLAVRYVELARAHAEG